MTIQQWKYGDRTFKVSDRVKAYYEGKWYTGTIISFAYMRNNYPKALCSKEVLKATGCVFVEEIMEERGPRVIFDNLRYASALIQTDERVEKSEGLLDGYGLQSSITGKHLIHEHEKEYDPGPEFTFVEDSDDEDPPLPF